MSAPAFFEHASSAEARGLLLIKARKKEKAEMEALKKQGELLLCYVQAPLQLPHRSFDLDLIYCDSVDADDQLLARARWAAAASRSAFLRIGSCRPMRSACRSMSPADSLKGRARSSGPLTQLSQHDHCSKTDAPIRLLVGRNLPGRLFIPFPPFARSRFMHVEPSRSS